jgi:putative transposase
MLTTRRSGTGSSPASWPPAGSRPGRTRRRGCVPAADLAGGHEAARPGRTAGPPGHDDLAARQVTAPGPGRAWLAGLTGHPAGEGKRHPGAINGAWPDRSAGYWMGSRRTAGLAVSAPRNALALRCAAGTVVVHPGGGSRLRSAAFARTLASHGLTGSTGRAGARGGNAAVGSFFALVQKNVLGRQRWITREQLRLAVITWVERTCHRRRRQGRPGRLTPIEYETISQAAHAA